MESGDKEIYEGGLMKRAFFVLGSESSGTRLLTRCLMEINGVLGDEGHCQRLDILDSRGITCDYRLPQDGIDMFIVRRSFPHGVKYHDIGDMVRKAETGGYTPFIFVTVRDWKAMRTSVRREHYRGDRIDERIQNAYKKIFNGVIMSGAEMRIITYESLIARPVGVLNTICEDLGLSWSGKIPFTINDGNAKYYKD